MKNKKVLVLGGNGMAGHTISLYLCKNGYNVTTLTRRPIFLDEKITNLLWDGDLKYLETIIGSNEYCTVINCIGMLNAACDKDPASAIFANSYLPHFLVKITSSTKTKIIHLSTDCVFSGEKGNYIESDEKDGKTFYDKTKGMGEFNLNGKDIIFRNSIVGPEINPDGTGLFNWFMKQENAIKGYDNWLWNGITTLELSKKILLAIENNYSGLYQLTNNLPISKYSLLKLFNDIFKRNVAISRDSIPHKIDKTLSDTQKKEIFSIPTYKQMVEELQTWINENDSLYKHYSTKVK